MNTVITVQSTVNAPAAKVWNLYNTPEHVVNWNNASEDWHTPHAENDLRVGGQFKYTMAAKDGSFSFDFGGEYTTVDQEKEIAYVLGDGRKVQVTFVPAGDGTTVTTQFEAESQNSIEMQQGGWQAILDNFKKYAEAN
ncbi:SRPBCC family protein [Chitinophaga sp. sic0106]|uniref:SRPBCC family protein n=1 Tax=Chitinophaga sp. sic0106 TaxID=2854785 RepID=UPI001C451C8D|nr:SRPBCC family protein [Chitinophaga sp. sic0106]MBV7534007.1 SRPBCC family protein [Chitinophaga sp. sic0106]